MHRYCSCFRELCPVTCRMPGAGCLLSSPSCMLSSSEKMSSNTGACSLVLCGHSSVAKLHTDILCSLKYVLLLGVVVKRNQKSAQKEMQAVLPPSRSCFCLSLHPQLSYCRAGVDLLVIIAFSKKQLDGRKCFASDLLLCSDSQLSLEMW